MKELFSPSLDEARQGLEIIEKSRHETLRATHREAGSYFLIWGLVYVLVPLVVLYFHSQAGWLANGLVAVGVVATLVVGFRSPVRSRLGFRLGIFWWVAFSFAVVWVIILGGEDFPRLSVQVEGRQTWGFGVTVAMMVFVLMGLVSRYPMLVVLGLGITVLVVTGYFVAWDWWSFWPWMAACSGGPLLAAGVWCKLWNRGSTGEGRSS
ncbi:MAG: hypothetical protein AAGD22_10730 [Verrucomicrobiota bacterium]